MFSIGVFFIIYTSSRTKLIIGWEFRQSWTVNWDDGKTNLGIYSTTFRGHNGNFDQRVGGLQFRSGNFRFRYENDGGMPFEWAGNSIAGGTDYARTTALYLGVGDVEVNIKFFTVEGHKDSVKQYPGAKEGVYTNSEANQFSLGQVTVGFFGHQFGFHDERFRGLRQNKIAHNNLQPTPWFIERPDRFPARFVYQYQSHNPYTLC